VERAALEHGCGSQSGIEPDDKEGKRHGSDGGGLSRAPISGIPASVVIGIEPKIAAAEPIVA